MKSTSLCKVSIYCSFTLYHPVDNVRQADLYKTIKQWLQIDSLAWAFYENKKIKSTQTTFPHVLQLLKNIKNLRKSISTIVRTHLLKFDYQPKNRFFSYNKFSRFWLQELIDLHTKVRQQWKLFPSDQREKFSLFLKKLLWIYLLF